ncbi:hypothetical protein [Indioceanicola profundi]|uniref:hypothetical protein n=1 Tax=Indioceanicola profundi TaxID=2220096 RepID=UPI000E6AB974|nr:hypothetical protein [Indioceanicola profundi]
MQTVGREPAGIPRTIRSFMRHSTGAPERDLERARRIMQRLWRLKTGESPREAPPARVARLWIAP